MSQLYLIRHAESLANAQHILASRSDFALSPRGEADAAQLAAEFCTDHRVAAILCSPLLRARQTAQPFADQFGLTIETDQRLIEQDLGRFSGLTYAQAEADPGYCTDRTARWEWQPEGGGESYRMIADRVTDFLNTLAKRPEPSFLLVTHAVTLRLFRAALEGTLPQYPEKIAGNGEIWTCDFQSLDRPTTIQIVETQQAIRRHRE